MKCKECGQPMLPKGKTRQCKEDYRHATGCSLQDPDYVTALSLDDKLCSDCPPADYPPDYESRCLDCPWRHDDGY